MLNIKKTLTKIMVWIKEKGDLIGSTTMGTTATTITGAIAEHEGNISNLNSNLISYLHYVQTTEKNLNNFPNFSVIWANNSSGVFTNAPVVGAVHVITMYTVSTTHAIQIAIGADGVSIYLRGKIDGTWKTWRKITTTTV